jgi:RNA polymerase sigma-70 factor (ECF subfamily)
MDESQVLKLCRQGELELLEELVRLHADSLYRFCYHLCGNADGAAELFQDTWVRALRNFHRCKAEVTILGWLFSIAANLQRDRFRRKGRWTKILATLGNPPPSAGPEDILTAQEQQASVRMAVNELPDAQRIPLILFYYEDLSIDAIARLLDMAPGTIKSRLHRARKHLKSRLEVLS